MPMGMGLEDIKEKRERQLTNQVLNDRKSLEMFFNREPDFNFVNDVMNFLRQYRLGKKVQLDSHTFHSHFYYSHFGRKLDFQYKKETSLIIPLPKCFSSHASRCVDNLAKRKTPARWKVNEEPNIYLGRIAPEEIHLERIFNIKPKVYSNLLSINPINGSRQIRGAVPIKLMFTTKEKYWEP